MRTADFDAFETLTDSELIVLGMIWRLAEPPLPPADWGDAKQAMLAQLSPAEAAELRAKHAARVDRQDRELPVECYAAVQWSALAERCDGLPHRIRQKTLAPWRELFPPMREHPAEIIEEVASNAPIERGSFDFGGGVFEQRLIICRLDPILRDSGGSDPDRDNAPLPA